jgi:hypothetical protein
LPTIDRRHRWQRNCPTPGAKLEPVYLGKLFD